MRMNTVETGIVRLCADPSLLESEPGIRRGLFTNFTGTMPDLGRNVDAMLAAGIRIDALFSPEHGLWGSAQAGKSEPNGADEATGLPVYDTYRHSGDELAALITAADVAELVVDLQDCGARFYTYIWSLFDVMVEAAKLQIPVVVLDRPNPLASLPAQGPGLLDECSSFVGRTSIPLIYSLTIGELARQFNASDVPQRAGRPAGLTVIAMANWSRTTPVADSVIPWVSPSLNLPTLTSVHAYPGTCVFEGTNASEGRGTTHPFEMIGAGWVDSRYAAALRERDLPGTLFRELKFVPMFSKWHNQLVRGVQLHVSDAAAFNPLLTGFTMLQVMAELYPSDFAFLDPVHEGRPHFIDLLWGSDVLRRNTADEWSAVLRESPPPAPISPEIRLYD